jgi:hypothetical protein
MIRSSKRFYKDLVVSVGLRGCALVSWCGSRKYICKRTYPHTVRFPFLSILNSNLVILQKYILGTSPTRVLISHLISISASSSSPPSIVVVVPVSRCSAITLFLCACLCIHPIGSSCISLALVSLGYTGLPSREDYAVLMMSSNSL